MKLLKEICLACLLTSGLFVFAGCSKTGNNVSGGKQQSEPVVEVLTYPLLLRQNFTNNFVLASNKLGKAHTESDRYLALPEAAKLAFVFGKIDDAHDYATELLTLDAKFQAEPWRNGDAVFAGNFVLGRIAVQEGHIEDAKKYLLASGKSVGSPVLGSFGPNMSLAKDLIQHEERKTVLQYFELCRKFWSVGNDKLTQWSEDVKAGNVPDFGGNLYY
jgi:hypothetical protein